MRHLSAQSYRWEVLVVDDGSSDGTKALASEWAQAQPGVRLETIPHAGKGAAVRHGMLAATGELRFMCDADLAMPIDGLPAFLERMDAGYDVVIGSRQIAGARRFNEPAVRHVLGRIFNWVVRLLGVGGFQDTQCGFKCFRGEAAERLFGLQRTKGFGFDVEILYLARKTGLRVLEMPIEWHHHRASKVRAGLDSFLMLRDTLLVRWRALLGRYDTGPVAGTEAKSPGVFGPDPSVEEALTGSPEHLDGRGLALVVPTYNEADNLPDLAERFFALGIPNSRMIVVDDSSPDGTAGVARALAGRFSGRMQIIQRDGKRGLGTAYVEGFSRALGEGVEYVLQMDADLSHAPEYIPAFLEALRGADVVVGSRYVKGGGVSKDWGIGRRMLSSFANLGIRLVAGLRVRDPTSGFKGFRAGALSSLRLGQIRCKGFGFQAEVAHACQRQGHRVVEYPIVFEDRAKGRSKMSLLILLEALWHLSLLRWRQ